MYFRSNEIVEAGGRMKDLTVPEFIPFDKPNMAKDFIETVENALRAGRRDVAIEQKPVKTKSTPESPVVADEPEVEDEPPFDTDEDDIDVDDMFEEEDTDVDSKYPDNLADIIRKEFKELTDKQMKADVRAIISEYGKLNDVPEEGLHRIYDVIHG